MIHNVEMTLGDAIFKLETGKIAKQANGAVWLQYADTIILITAVASDEPRTNIDFLPLTVEYREKAYAAGKIPGGFFKRETRPGDKETLSARQVDRTIRPMFPDGFTNEIQIIIFTLSSDQENNADVLGICGASVALMISDIPFTEPVAGVRVGRINGEFIINPTFTQLEESDINVVISGTESSIAMVEGKAWEVSEEDMLEALEFGHKHIKQLIELQKKFIEKVGLKEKMSIIPVEYPAGLEEKIIELALEDVKQGCKIADKKERKKAFKEIIIKLEEQLQENIEEPDPEITSTIKAIFYTLEKKVMREMILNDSIRIDGRKKTDIRQITCEIALLPRTHGSALFTRGQTQALVATTLGTKVDEQRLDALEGESWKTFMLHYNFPPFCTGEAKFIRGPGRREIGHGTLAERALEPVIPSEENFPYTIRIVADVMESNGSSSMASVCGASLSLMDAGVPIKCPVAGIAMGLIKEDDKIAILTDILGDEDHMGDMDFKVAGTREGITAFQMDIKIKGITIEIMKEALAQAKEARISILNTMEQTIKEPKADLSPYAPRILIIKISTSKIGTVIGPGGKMIRSISEETGAIINIESDGTVFIASVDKDAAEKAKERILRLTEEVEYGKVYIGKVTRITSFGAFAEILPGQDGLIHISELAHYRVNKVEDILRVGDEVEVKVIKIKDGKIDLSRKALLERKKY